MTKKKLEQLNALLNELHEKMNKVPGLKTAKINSLELNGERLIKCKNGTGGCYWVEESKCNNPCND